MKLKSYVFLIAIIFVPILISFHLAPKSLILNNETELPIEEVEIMSGVIDRYVNDQAVILIEEINEEMIIERTSLPLDLREGTWLTVKQKKGEPTTYEVDEEKTNEQIKKSDDLLRKLK